VGSFVSSIPFCSFPSIISAYNFSNLSLVSLPLRRLEAWLRVKEARSFFVFAIINSNSCCRLVSRSSFSVTVLGPR